MSQLNTQTFKKLNTNARVNFIDATKTYKGISKLCKYCGFSHKFGQCPIKGAQCKICQKIGHFVKVCTSKHRKAKKK